MAVASDLIPEVEQIGSPAGILCGFAAGGLTMIGLRLVGALSAFFLLRGSSEATVAIFLSFGAAALIYLIAEDLLVESIQAEESLFSTAMLFSGFAVVLALKLLS